jgi:hypothetical protein
MHTQLDIAAKWKRCYVVYNQASYKRGERARPMKRTGAGEAEQQPARLGRRGFR